MAGFEVRHPYWGNGRIIAKRGRSMDLLVEFGNMRVWLPLREVKFRTNALSIVKTARPVVQPLYSSENASQWRILEACKLGIVPLEDIPSFIYGREKEIREIEGWLSGDERPGGRGRRGGANPKARVAILEGEYGSGKTHFINYLAGYAMRQGYVVARADLDFSEVASYLPKRIYRSIITNLYYYDNGGRGGEERNFRDLLLKVLGEPGNSERFSSHIFFSPLIPLIREDGMEESHFRWIEGDEMPGSRVRLGREFPPLHSHTTASDNFCYILSGIGEMVKCAGYRGLILIVDEAEIASHHSKTFHRRRSGEFFSGLIHLAVGDAPDRWVRKGDGCRWFMGFNGYYESLNGFQFIHSGFNPTPYIFSKEAPIYLVLATTPGVWRDVIPEVERVDGLKIVHLSDMDNRTKFQVFTKLHDIYSTVYPGFRAGNDRREMEDLFRVILWRWGGNLRLFIRGAINAFDIKRRTPGISLHSLLK